MQNTLHSMLHRVLRALLVVMTRIFPPEPTGAPMSGKHLRQTVDEDAVAPIKTDNDKVFFKPSTKQYGKL